MSQNVQQQQPVAPPYGVQPGYQPNYYAGGPQQPHYHVPQQQQTVVINQPSAQPNTNGQPQNIQEWSSGICGCCEDCASCCYAFWCYQCFLCTLANKMDENCCGPMCCASMSLSGILSLIGINLPVPCHPNMFLVAMRTKLRSKYGIRGGICKDICCLCWCEFCAVTQMMRQLKHFGAA